MATNPTSAPERTETPTFSTKYEPDFIDRATLPLGRAETLTEIIEDFIEGVADNREEACHGDALVHALQLELAELRAVLETAIESELPKQAHIQLASICARHGVSPDSMHAAVAEILNAAASRADSAWETETAGRLLTLAHNLEGTS